MSNEFRDIMEEVKEAITRVPYEGLYVTKDAEYPELTMTFDGTIKKEEMRSVVDIIQDLEPGETVLCMVIGKNKNRIGKINLEIKNFSRLKSVMEIFKPTFILKNSREEQPKVIDIKDLLGTIRIK